MKLTPLCSNKKCTYHKINVPEKQSGIFVFTDTE
jgi:hypothetical protein